VIRNVIREWRWGLGTELRAELILELHSRGYTGMRTLRCMDLTDYGQFVLGERRLSGLYYTSACTT
jgi:hypothetical protein